MAIVLRHNYEHEITRVEYSGALAAAELHAHPQFNADNPQWLSFDCLSIALADVDIRGLSIQEIDTLFKSYQSLFEPLNLVIMRRSSWICEAPAAKPLLEHWLNRRNDTSQPWTEVKLFDTYEEVADWLLLSPSGRTALENTDGFVEIARFGPPQPTRGFAR